MRIVLLAAMSSVQESIDDPEMSHATNFGGMLSVLMAAIETGVRRIIFASSAAVYGIATEQPVNENVCPNSSFGLRHPAACLALRACSRNDGA